MWVWLCFDKTSCSTSRFLKQKSHVDRKTISIQSNHILMINKMEVYSSRRVEWWYRHVQKMWFRLCFDKTSCSPSRFFKHNHILIEKLSQFNWIESHFDGQWNGSLLIETHRMVVSTYPKDVIPIKFLIDQTNC